MLSDDLIKVKLSSSVKMIKGLGSLCDEHNSSTCTQLLFTAD